MQKYLIAVLSTLPIPAAGLSLADAARMALNDNPAITAARQMESAAATRLRQVDTAKLPRVQFQESIQGGNNPVYVFSSLLTQRQFSQANFAVNALVRPDPLQNFQSQLGVEQSVYDFGRTDARRREAETGRSLAAEERRRRELEIVTHTARAYYGALLAEAAKTAAEQALKSVEATRDRAMALRSAQMATDADVLAVEVHLATAREEIIRRDQQAEVARAALNHALGQPLDTVQTLTTPLSAPLPAESPALAIQRPEVKMAGLQEELAKARAAQASAMMRPELGIRFQLEADRQNFVTKGGANWIAMGTLRWNLFDGGMARQMRAEAGHAATAAASETRAAASAVTLQVRQAESAIRAAAARESVTQAAIAQAKETIRILRNRYGAGLANVTEVLRAEAAMLEAETRRLAALHDQRIARIEREAAAGTLNGDSNVLR
ncbi:MAG: TolC family protein [Bryobacterales bacterium]|nr:TolC family protein [Bryobacterales bacterium]